MGPSKRLAAAGSMQANTHSCDRKPPHPFTELRSLVFIALVWWIWGEHVQGYFSYRPVGFAICRSPFHRRRSGCDIEDVGWEV